MKQSLILMGLLSLLIPSFLFAHGDIHEQIIQISKRIEKDPNNSALYLKRGQLYVQHKDFDKAEKDYQKVRFLDKKLIITDILMAQLLVKKKQPQKGLPYINTYLQHKNKDVNGLLLRAKIYQQLQKQTLAKQDIKTAFTNLKNPLPKHYILIAEATLLADNSNIAEAIVWLQKGQSQFGFDIVLKEKEIDLLTKSKQYDGALLAIDEVLERFQRKEKWLFQKGQICENANQPKVAIIHYKATLKAIHNLPKRLQMTGKMMELEAASIQNIKNCKQ